MTNCKSITRNESILRLTAAKASILAGRGRSEKRGELELKVRYRLRRSRRREASREAIMLFEILKNDLIFNMRLWLIYNNN